MNFDCDTQRIYTQPLTLHCFPPSAKSLSKAMTTQEDNPPAKRRKLNAKDEGTTAEHHHHPGLNRPISPPPSGRKALVVSNPVLTPTWGFDALEQIPTSVSPNTAAQQIEAQERDSPEKGSTKYVPSPIQLTKIKDLAHHQNVDAVGLKDILDNPGWKECWNFNYLHDIDFVM